MAATVQSSASVTWGASPRTITKPSGLSTGDLLLGIFRTDDDNTNNVDVPTGWTSYGTNTNSGSNRVMYKVAEASDASATDFSFTSSAASFAGVLLRIKGYRPDDIISDDATALDTGDNDSLSVAVSLTPSYENSLLVFGVFMEDDNNGTTTSDYTITGPTNPTWTEQADLLKTGNIASLAVATANIDNDTEITNLAATITGRSVRGWLLVVPSLEPGATGTHTLLQASPTFFAPAPSVGVSGTIAAILENTSDTVFSPSASASGAVWTIEEKGTTTWTNETK